MIWLFGLILCTCTNQNSNQVPVTNNIIVYQAKEGVNTGAFRPPDFVTYAISTDGLGTFYEKLPDGLGKNPTLSPDRHWIAVDAINIKNICTRCYMHRSRGLM